MKSVKLLFLILFLLFLFFVFSCKPSIQEINTTPFCIEKLVENSRNIDSILIKECYYKNHLFKSVGTPDYKGRYSYQYEIFKIKRADTIKTKNTIFFKDKTTTIEEILNKKLKEEYYFDLNHLELKDCLKQINFRYYNLDEFGISFMGENIMTFYIDHKGVSGACFNVSRSFVLLNLNTLSVID